jgi:hypothetical protein
MAELSDAHKLNQMVSYESSGQCQASSRRPSPSLRRPSCRRQPSHNPA